jgi:hypothetical protein
MLAARPELVPSLSEEDKMVLAFAAGDGKVEAVRLMLLAGMSMTIHGDTGGTPLHQAAWYGQLEVVKLLLAHHAPLEEKDTTYGGTPLGWACHGSMNCRNPNGDYPGNRGSVDPGGSGDPARTQRHRRSKRGPPTIRRGQQAERNTTHAHQNSKCHRVVLGLRYA